MNITAEAERILWEAQNPEKAAEQKAERVVYREALKNGDWKTAHDYLKKNHDELMKILDGWEELGSDIINS